MNAFHLLFNPILDLHAPIKNIKIRSRPNPFVTAEIRSEMKIGDKWRKLARKTNDPLVWAEYGVSQKNPKPLKSPIVKI